MSTWHYKLDDQHLGPVSFQELAALVREGKVSERTQVARAGTMNWEHAWRVPGLFRAAGIVDAGDSPPSAPVQADLATQTTLTPALSHSERKMSTRRSVSLALPLSISIAVGLLAVGFFYRWAEQTTIAFPMPPTVVDGELINCYFPLVGRCTTLECVLLYLDVFAVAALAAWHVARKNRAER